MKEKLGFWDSLVYLISLCDVTSVSTFHPESGDKKEDDPKDAGEKDADVESTHSSQGISKYRRALLKYSQSYVEKLILFYFYPFNLQVLCKISATSLGPLSPQSNETMAAAPLISPASTNTKDNNSSTELDKIQSNNLLNLADEPRKEPRTVFSYDTDSCEPYKFNPRHSITFPTGSVFAPDFSGGIFIPGMHPSCNAFKRTFSHPQQSELSSSRLKNFMKRKGSSDELKKNSAPEEKAKSIVKLESPSDSNSSKSSPSDPSNSKSTSSGEPISLPNLEDSTLLV